MRLNLCFALFVLGLTLAQAIPASRIEKKSVTDEAIPKKDLKIDDLGDDKDRAKKSTTFCVEVRPGSGATQTTCGCKDNAHGQSGQLNVQPAPVQTLNLVQPAQQVQVVPQQPQQVQTYNVVQPQTYNVVQPAQQQVEQVQTYNVVQPAQPAPQSSHSSIILPAQPVQPVQHHLHIVQPAQPCAQSVPTVNIVQPAPQTVVQPAPEPIPAPAPAPVPAPAPAPEPVVDVEVKPEPKPAKIVVPQPEPKPLQIVVPEPEPMETVNLVPVAPVCKEQLLVVQKPVVMMQEPERQLAAVVQVPSGHQCHHHAMMECNCKKSMHPATFGERSMSGMFRNAMMPRGFEMRQM